MPAPPRENLNPFSDYHRARRLARAGRAVAIAIPAGLAIAAMCVVGSVAPAPAHASAETTSSGHSPASTPIPTVTPTPVPSPRAMALPTQPVVTVAAAKPAPSVAPVTRISIAASGYQKELDECQWVRMDLGIPEPIVGAHTTCGGSVVLQLKMGDLVVLQGQGLDGRYVVTDSRQAHGGEIAATATAGMDAQVILQTCYPGTGGRERLVGLELQN